MILISISDKRKYSVSDTAEALYKVYADIRGYGSARANYEHGADGSPYLEGSPFEVHVSASHSGDLNAVALSDKPCGIDIEKLRDDAELMKISARFGVKTNDLKEFFEYFCSAEAYAKASGTPLPEVLKNPNVHARVFDWIKGYCLAVYGEGVLFYCPAGQFLP